MYAVEKYKNSQCLSEREYSKCEYLIVCPFIHQDEIENYSGDTNVFKMYSKMIKKNINQIQSEIENLEKIKKMHSCSNCNQLMKKEYYLSKPCLHLICKNCFLKKVIFFI